MQKCHMRKLGGKGGSPFLSCLSRFTPLLFTGLIFSLPNQFQSRIFQSCRRALQSVPLCSALMPYDGCSVCQAQMLLKLFQQSWSAARANVFISSTALCAQEPPIYPSEGNAFWWPSKSLSEASCWETGNCAPLSQIITVGQLVTRISKCRDIAHWIRSLAQLREWLPPLKFAACCQTRTS